MNNKIEKKGCIKSLLLEDEISNDSLKIETYDDISDYNLYEYENNCIRGYSIPYNDRIIRDKILRDKNGIVLSDGLLNKTNEQELIQFFIYNIDNLFMDDIIPKKNKRKALENYRIQLTEDLKKLGYSIGCGISPYHLNSINKIDKLELIKNDDGKIVESFMRSPNKNLYSYDINESYRDRSVKCNRK